MTQLQPNAPSKPLLDMKALDIALDKTKAFLFFKKNGSWLGSLLCNHDFLWDFQAPTAWCNGTQIGINPYFFSVLPQEERVTLLAHELYHTMCDHMERFQKRDPEIWNQACDFMINLDLQRQGFIFDAFYEIGVPPCLDPAFTDMFTEEIYDLLIKQGHKPPPMMALICPGQGKPGDTPQDASGSGSDPNVDPGLIPALGGDLRQPLSSDPLSIKKSIVQARQAALNAKQAGTLPGEVEQILENFLNPVLPWDVLLARYFNDLSQDDYSWKRPSRRYQDEYLPSLLGENGLEHLIYYLDVSGSITDDQALRFFSEVRYIHKQFRPKRLTLVTFDDEIQDTYDFFQDDPFEQIVIHGRGGTSLDPVRRHIKEHRPTAAVIFSDLHVTPMKNNPGYPVLWVVMDNKNATTYFGKRIDLGPDQLLSSVA